MKAAVIYWSKTGNTEKVAQAIREGLEEQDVEVTYRRVEEASDLDWFAYDLVCLGFPSCRWSPPKPVDELLSRKFGAYHRQGRVHTGAPKLPGKYALIFTTFFSGPHTGIDEAIPAAQYAGQFFAHLGFTVLDEWYIVGEFHGSEERRTMGRLGDIRGRPNEEDLAQVRRDVTRLLARAPRAMRRPALPLAGALVATLVFVAILWGPRIWTPDPEIEWVEVPTGEFTMGSDPAVDPGADGDEQPQHTVYLDAYRIGKYEVTNAQYAACVRARVCDEPREIVYYEDPDYAGHPVVYVRWFDARDFCRWIGGRLPTEAEWEKAARGPSTGSGDGRIYPWGDEPPDCDRANTGGCVGNTTVVGRYPSGASLYGAMDMAGNVWEWVADWYDGNYYARSPDRNPPGPDAGSYRVVRGGSWGSYARNARAADRGFDFPVVSYYLYLGFRCVSPISTRPGS